MFPPSKTNRQLQETNTPNPEHLRRVVMFMSVTSLLEKTGCLVLLSTHVAQDHWRFALRILVLFVGTMTTSAPELFPMGQPLQVSLPMLLIPLIGWIGLPPVHLLLGQSPGVPSKDPLPLRYVVRLVLRHRPTDS